MLTNPMLLCYNDTRRSENTTERRHVEEVWEHSSVGRASALQAEGHRFEPCCSQYGPVVQLVRTPPCHGGGRGFESHPGRISKTFGDDTIITCLCSSVGRAGD